MAHRFTTPVLAILILVLFYVNVGYCELDLIWRGPMGKFTRDWFTNKTSPRQMYKHNACPSSPDCVQISADESIYRRTKLEILPHIRAYHSFTIQLDINASGDDTPQCHIMYKYDDDTDYKALLSSDVANNKMTNQQGSIPIHHDRDAEILYIKLSASGSENGFCHFSNIHFFGHMADDNIILYDNMEDINATKWNSSNYDSVSQCSANSYAQCPNGGSGAAVQENNFIYKSIPNIDKYMDIYIKFDVYLEGIKRHDACQLWFRYDTDPEDDYYLLRTLNSNRDKNDRLLSNIIVTIHEDPHVQKSSALYIKFVTVGNSNTSEEVCYFDNVYVKGNAINEHRLQSRIARDARASGERNIIIIGDMGGQDDSPYTTRDQLNIADMMNSIGRDHSIEGIIALGDNIYDDGVEDEDDDRFESTFEEVYPPLSRIGDVNWWLTTGNHDYRDNIMGEVEYTQESDTWNMPELYYTKEWSFGGIKLLFVALDTYILCGSVTSSGHDDCRPKSKSKAETHWDWLEDKLQNSGATFSLVGGHTPIYSYAEAHGPTEQLIERLDPLLKEYGVSANVFAHDHVIQFIEVEDQTMAYIGSGAGHDCRSTDRDYNSRNPGRDALKYLDCDDGGYVRLAIDPSAGTMKAYYYLGDSSSPQFTSGTWYKDGSYRTTDGDTVAGSGNNNGGGGDDGGDNYNNYGGGGDDGGDDFSGNCVILSGFNSQINGEWAQGGTYSNKPYFTRGKLKLFYDSVNGNVHIDSALGTGANWYCEGSSITQCTRGKWYSINSNGEWNDDTDSDATVTQCAGGGGDGDDYNNYYGGGGNDDDDNGGDSGRCIRITGFDDFDEYNGDWETTGTYYKKGNYYLMREDGYWGFSTSKSWIDWDESPWCSSSSVSSCDGWDSYYYDEQQVDFGSCRSRSYVPGEVDCLQIHALEPRFNGAWQSGGSYNNRALYKKGNYWLFSTIVSGRGGSYWTISETKGTPNWDNGWCTMYDIKQCSGEWKYNYGRVDDNCEFISCNAFSYEEPKCLQGNDYETMVCVDYNGGYKEFNLSHVECEQDNPVYSHMVSGDEEGPIYYLHFDNTSVLGEQWEISINHTESLGGAYCRNVDLLQCTYGNWVDDETMEVDETIAVFNRKCNAANDDAAAAQWNNSKTLVPVAIIALVVVIMVIFGIVFVFCSKKRRAISDSKMIAMTEEDSKQEIAGVDADALIEESIEKTTAVM